MKILLPSIFIFFLILTISYDAYAQQQILTQEQLESQQSQNPDDQKDDSEKINWPYTEIAVATIPSIIGAITAYVTTDRWQKYKTKVGMVKEIIESYQNSAKKFAVLQETFALSLALRYAGESDAKGLLTGNKIEFTLKNFPTNQDELPYKTFEVEYKNLENEIINIRTNASKFLSTVRLYTDQKDLETKFQEIQRRNIYTWLVIQKMFESSDVKEFVKNAKEYQAVINETKTLIANLENELVKIKIHRKPF